MICSTYFTNSFDSFVKQESLVKLVSKDKQNLKSSYFVIFDNSLSKKEVLDESSRIVNITNEVTF